jgi:hypothetical protein
LLVLGLFFGDTTLEGERLRQACLEEGKSIVEELRVEVDGAQVVVRYSCRGV